MNKIYRNTAFANFVFILYSGIFIKPSLAAEPLKLEYYRQSVQSKSLKISVLASEKDGAFFEKSQGKQLTTPQAFIEYQASKDKSPTLTPEFSGTERNGDEIKVGIQAQTEIGIKPRVYAFSQSQNVSNISSLATPDLSLQRKGFGAEAEISLWKNAFGKDIRGQIESLKNISESKALQAEASKTAFLLEADLIYFESSYLKQAILIKEDLVRQGEKLLAWTKNQSSDRLLEPVHVAQATAALQSRKLALVALRQQLLTNLIKISQLSGHTVSEDTPFDSIDEILLKIPDVNLSVTQKVTLKSISKAVEAERLNLDLSSEAFKPDLSFKAQYLSFSDTGRADDSARCKSVSDCRAYSLSLNLSFPIDFENTQKGQAASRARIQSLEKNLELEQQNSKTESQQLIVQSQALKDQIQSLEKLIEAQELRLKKERERQAKGRATTFDLILSEQELGESRMALAEAKTKYLSTLSQFRLFEVVP